MNKRKENNKEEKEKKMKRKRRKEENLIIQYNDSKAKRKMEADWSFPWWYPGKRLYFHTVRNMLRFTTAILCEDSTDMNWACLQFFVFCAHLFSSGCVNWLFQR